MKLEKILYILKQAIMQELVALRKKEIHTIPNLAAEIPMAK
jgi:hypothetical protein